MNLQSAYELDRARLAGCEFIARIPVRSGVEAVRPAA